MNIDVVATQQRLYDLADRLDTNGNASTAARLRDLADAVAGSPSAPEWALVDIFRVFSPDDLAEHPRDGVARWFEFFRNVLVLLPLIVTWVGIWTAVESYHGLIKDSPQLAAQSFIYLWQGGFEGRTWLTLSWVAIIDAALLLFGVVIPTIVVYGRQLSSGRSPDGSSLREALVEADLALSIHRQPSGMGGLTQAREALEKIADSLKQQPEQVKQSLQQVVLQVAQTMQQAGSQMTQTMQQAGSQMAQTLQHTASRFESAAQEVSASARSLEQTHAKMQKAVSALSTPMDALATQTKELGPAFQETSAKLQMWVDLERESVEKITRVGTLLNTLVGQLTKTTTDLIAATNGVEQATNVLLAVAQPLAGAQTGLITALTREREAQTNLANVVSKATYDLDLTLQQVRESGVRLHGIAVDLTTIAQTLPPMLDLMQGNLGQAVQSYSDAGVKPRPQTARSTSGRPQP